jgi:hypothetical protein
VSILLRNWLGFLSEYLVDEEYGLDTFAKVRLAGSDEVECLGDKLVGGKDFHPCEYRIENGAKGNLALLARPEHQQGIDLDDRTNQLEQKTLQHHESIGLDSVQPAQNRFDRGGYPLPLPQLCMPLSISR